MSTCLDLLGFTHTLKARHRCHQWILGAADQLGYEAIFVLLVLVSYTVVPVLGERLVGNTSTKMLEIRSGAESSPNPRTTASMVYLMPRLTSLVYSLHPRM